ncbi:MAG: 23S rRNA (adenine(2503)-C(2))-methyltransferase RlmN [Planctomycetota bacterium]|nr:23S rRNA (adenine(2503)-C(2))-methyltransferase RlmN [Planctomycetota bacterium]
MTAEIPLTAEPSDGTPSPEPKYKGLLAWPKEALEERFVELGGRPFHARVAREQLLGKGVLDYDSMTSLPAQLREALKIEVPLLAGSCTQRVEARDGTIKLLLDFPGDESGKGGGVETVHIPPLGAKRGQGATLCVSTQIGCPVACPFCASGLDGLARNLQPHEILEQFAQGRAQGELRRVVVMGIGEPLLNFENLTLALEQVHEIVGLGARKITVSSVGFPERLRQAARSQPRFQLAISLHTPDDDQHDELIPALRGTPIDEILAAGDDWFQVTGREVTYEYVLLGGTNDSAQHAERLVRRLGGRRATVNLIPYNSTRGLGYHRPAPEDVEIFATLLREGGIVATVRYSRGADGAAACGQLRMRA